MNRSLVWKLVPAVAAALMLASCVKETPKVDFALKDAAGKTVRLSDYRGKVVLLNFWATWCGPCKIEIPWFQEFENKYKDKDFVVLGVSMDEDGWESVKPYMAEHKFNYPVVIGNDAVGKLFGEIDDLPTTFLIDKSGSIADKHVGLISKDQYESEISSMLKGGGGLFGSSANPSKTPAMIPSVGPAEAAR